MYGDVVALEVTQKILNLPLSYRFFSLIHEFYIGAVDVSTLVFYELLSAQPADLADFVHHLRVTPALAYPSG